MPPFISDEALLFIEGNGSPHKVEPCSILRGNSADSEWACVLSSSIVEQISREIMGALPKKSITNSLPKKGYRKISYFLPVMPRRHL